MLFVIVTSKSGLKAYNLFVDFSPRQYQVLSDNFKLQGISLYCEALGRVDIIPLIRNEGKFVHRWAIERQMRRKTIDKKLQTGSCKRKPGDLVT